MIYLFLADGFEEIEAIAPTDLLRRAGAEVKTVGVGSRVVTGSHGISITADLTESEVCPDRADMVILPGGVPGTPHLEASETVHAAVAFCARNGRKVAAICAAPSILGHMGLLRGHSAVCFPGYEQDLDAAEIPDVPVCVSGNFITARGAGVAVEFGLKLIEVLYNVQKSQEIRKKIQCV